MCTKPLTPSPSGKNWKGKSKVKQDPKLAKPKPTMAKPSPAASKFLPIEISQVQESFISESTAAATPQPATAHVPVLTTPTHQEDTTKPPQLPSQPEPANTSTQGNVLHDKEDDDTVFKLPLDSLKTLLK